MTRFFALSRTGEGRRQIGAYPGKVDTGFSEKDMRQRKNPECLPIPLHRDALQLDP
jgi:hypothetical protein